MIPYLVRTVINNKKIWIILLYKNLNQGVGGKFYFLLLLLWKLFLHKMSRLKFFNTTHFFYANTKPHYTTRMYFFIFSTYPARLIYALLDFITQHTHNYIYQYLSGNTSLSKFIIMFAYEIDKCCVTQFLNIITIKGIF